MKNRVYTLVVDSNLDSSIQELQKRFHPKERIVSTDVRGDKYIVMTEIDDGKSRNLLLEDMAKGKIPPEILGLHTEKDDG